MLKVLLKQSSIAHAKSNGEICRFSLLIADTFTLTVRFEPSESIEQRCIGLLLYASVPEVQKAAGHEGVHVQARHAHPGEVLGAVAGGEDVIGFVVEFD